LRTRSSVQTLKNTSDRKLRCSFITSGLSSLLLGLALRKASLDSRGAVSRLVHGPTEQDHQAQQAQQLQQLQTELDARMLDMLLGALSPEPMTTLASAKTFIKVGQDKS
jgi:hypothetical protein